MSSPLLPIKVLKEIGFGKLTKAEEKDTHFIKVYENGREQGFIIVNNETHAACVIATARGSDSLISYYGTDNDFEVYGYHGGSMIKEDKEQIYETATYFEASDKDMIKKAAKFVANKVGL